MARATTVRFSDEVSARLDQASARSGMPVNSIVVAACLEWMDRHTPEAGTFALPGALPMQGLTPAPRWATIRRAVELAMTRPGRPVYPFDRFTQSAQKLLTLAQAEAKSAGHSYIGTEHLLLASFADERFESAQILAALAVTIESARSALHELLTGGAPPTAPQIRPTSRVKAVIETAFKICGAAGFPLVSTGQMLLALSVEGKGIAARALDDLGATRERIEQTAGSIQPEP
jgi:hypothetical protein